MITLRRTSVLLLVAGLGIALLGGCSETNDLPNGVGTAYPDKMVGFQLDDPAQGEEVAVMHTSMGDMSIRFFPEAAPKAVENFKTHAQNGYFDGLTFHRVIKDFMIQGGDPEGNGTGGESIWGSPFADEFDQKLLNLRGSLAMANSGPDTNGSQFFINQCPASQSASKDTLLQQEQSLRDQAKAYYEQNKDTLKASYKNWQAFYDAQGLTQLASVPSWVPDAVWELYGKHGGNLNLDGAWRASGGHTVFGQVYEGLDVLDKIASVETDDSDAPKEPVLINSIDIVKYEG